MTRYRPTFVEVDLDAVAHNVRLLRPAGAELMAVVKADGYGHGDAEVAGAALEAGASVARGRARRGGARAARARDRRADPGPGRVPARLREGGARTRSDAHRLHGRGARRRGRGGPGARTAGGRAREGRHGDASRRPVAAGRRPGVRAPRSSRPGSSSRACGRTSPIRSGTTTGTLEQLARFRATAEALAAARIAPGLLHAANSGATIRFPQTHLDLVRPGAAVYGVDPGGGLAEPFGAATRAVVALRP